MKIHLAKFEPERLGGGWTFQANLAKAIPEDISNYDQADVYLISGASMVNRDDVLKAKADGKKVILRADNIIRNSRNRGTGMTRMKDFAEWADLVVYQSMFSKELLNDYLKPKESLVILNACDEEFFRPDPDKEASPFKRFLYARSSSDETKNWEMARSTFQGEDGTLTIVGKPLDPRVIEYNFDFFMGESAEYVGEANKSTMAKLYRTHDCLLYSYFNDACSNTLIEALCSGMEIVDCYGMAYTGGAPEIIEMFYDRGKEYFYLPRMAEDYKRAIRSIS